MSEAAENTRPASEGKNSRRRRVPGGRGPRKPASADGAAKASGPAETAPRTREPRERRERTEVTPVPEELIGTKASGTVIITIRNRRYNFGFISLARGEKAEDATIPRIYYNPSHVTEEGLKIYRGYEVEFDITKDEENRTVASNIRLTEEGRAIKERRDAEAVTKREERAKEAATKPAPAAEEGAEKSRRPRRPRAEKPATEGAAAAPAEPREPRVVRPRKVVNFTIQVQGDASKNFTLSTAVNGPIGRLKSLAFRAAGVEGEYSLYVVTAANPSGEFVTREVLNGLGDDATLLLGPKRDEPAAEKN